MDTDVLLRIAFLLLGTTLLVWMLRTLWVRWRTSISRPPATDAGIDEAELARAEEAVRRNRTPRGPDGSGGLPPGGSVGASGA